MTQIVRICRFGCNTKLGDFDIYANKYREIDASKTLHTRERCESLKQGPKGRDISVDVLMKKLSSIGIEINLQKLRNTVNGDKK